MLGTGRPEVIHQCEVTTRTNTGKLVLDIAFLLLIHLGYIVCSNGLPISRNVLWFKDPYHVSELHVVDRVIRLHILGDKVTYGIRQFDPPFTRSRENWPRVKSHVEGLCHCHYGPAALLLMTVMRLNGAEFTWMVLTEMETQSGRITRILEALATKLAHQFLSLSLIWLDKLPISCRKAKMLLDPSIPSSFHAGAAARPQRSQAQPFATHFLRICELSR